jgi:hypothetical protein
MAQAKGFGSRQRGLTLLPILCHQTQIRNLDSKVRAERDRNVHRGQGPRALKAVERGHQNRQKRQTQPEPSVTVIHIKFMKVIRMIQKKMVRGFQ